MVLLLSTMSLQLKTRYLRVGTMYRKTMKKSNRGPAVAERPLLLLELRYYIDGAGLIGPSGSRAISILSTGDNRTGKGKNRL